MAKSGHTIHPVSCRSDAPELGVVVVACVGHGEAFFVKRSIFARCVARQPGASTTLKPTSTFKRAVYHA